MRRAFLALAIAIQPVHGQATALVGATLIDGRGGPAIAQSTVVIEGGRITAVGPRATVRVPPGAIVLDLSGKFVLPGFVDANVHLTPYNFAGLAWNDSSVVQDGVRGAMELARHGVTLARDTYGLLPFQLAIRSRVNGDSLPASRIVVAGNIIGWGDVWSFSFSGSTGGRPQNDTVRRLSAALTQGVGEDLTTLQVDSLRRAIGAYIDRGPDFIKIGVTTHTSSPLFIPFGPRALAAIIDTAHRRGLLVDAHAGSVDAMRLALESGLDVIQHPEQVGGRVTDSLLDLLARRGVTCAMMPANVTGETWQRFKEHVAIGGRMWPAEMPPQMMRARYDSLRRLGQSLPTTKSASLLAFEEKRTNAERLVKRCTVAVATDAIVGGRPMGQSTLDAIIGLVELGMTPMQALVAATRNGARAAGDDRHAGTLERGKRADLVVLDANPLADIANIRRITAVYVGGRPLLPR